MRITTPSAQQAWALGAVGLGMYLAARAVRARSSFDFAGKSVVITGGSRGLGLVLARQLVGEGARVTLLARDDEELERAAQDLCAHDSSADVFTVTADIRQRDDAERAVAQTIERFGGVDVVINNAGIIHTGPVGHMSLADYEDAMKTHFWGPLYMMLAALPQMRSVGHGRIINISSIGGRISVPHLVPYCASKFALTGLSDGLRAELAHENIVVTTVFPGLMRTGSPVNAMFKGKHEQEYAWFAIADSFPGISIGAERAARQIVAAAKRGDAELVITLPARFAIVARTLAPEMFADAMALTNTVLPSATGREGDTARPGRASESEWAPSTLTAPTYAAAERNNEL
jgi:NAD(P)-dependent dehydrogenase (short-subunit alcohol dehydrogenase family)